MSLHYVVVDQVSSGQEDPLESSDVMIDFGYRIILWYVPDALSPWVQVSSTVNVMSGYWHLDP